MRDPRRDAGISRHPVWIGALALAWVVACASDQHPSADPAAPPKVLHAEPPASQRLTTNPFGGCDMCHTDVADEVSGGRHQANGIGCVNCHGASAGHVRDENNEVKPDHVFAREDVDAFCGHCHGCARQTVTKPAAATQGARKVCTDCHGAHTLRPRG